MTPETTTTVLQYVATYRTVTRKMIQRDCLPRADDRACRKILQKLTDSGLLGRTHMQVVNPSMGAPAPVMFPNQKTADFLACALGDEKWLSCAMAPPAWTYLYHWVQIAEFRVTLSKALALQSDVKIERCITEHEVANPDAREPEKKYTLYTLLREKPRLCHAPDLGLMIEYKGFRRAWYGEIDRMTSTVVQIAASKTPAVAALTEHHVARHFPEAAKVKFGVLMVTMSAGRRDLLQKKIAEKPGAELWRFANWHDLTPESMLHEPVFRDHEGKPVPLIRKMSEEARP